MGVDWLFLLLQPELETLTPEGCGPETQLCVCPRGTRFSTHNSRVHASLCGRHAEEPESSGHGLSILRGLARPPSQRLLQSKGSLPSLSHPLIRLLAGTALLLPPKDDNVGPLPTAEDQEDAMMSKVSRCPDSVPSFVTVPASCSLHPGQVAPR